MKLSAKSEAVKLLKIKSHQLNDLGTEAVRLQKIKEVSKKHKFCSGKVSHYTP